MLIYEQAEHLHRGYVGISQTTGFQNHFLSLLQILRSSQPILPEESTG